MSTTNTFPVDPTSLSFEAIRQDILDYIESLPDYLKWKDFYDSSAGLTYIDLLAGMMAYLQNNAITARRETYFRHAKARSSLIAGSQGLGYSTFRGHNAYVNLTITPNFTGILNKWEVMGSIKDLDMMLYEDTTFNNGISQTIKVIVGEIKTEVQLAISSEVASFRFTQDKVSEDIRAYIDSTEVETSNRILDLMKDKFSALSNALGSVDLLSLNQLSAPVQYNTNSEIRLDWIESKEIDFTETDVIFDYGTLVSYEIDELFEDPETDTSISINAPLFHETQYVIRGREDYVKVLRLLDTTILDASYRDISPSVVELVALREDLSLYSQLEKDAFISDLSSNRPMGLEPPEMTDAIQNIITLDITAEVSGISPAQSSVGTGNPVVDIQAVTQAYAKEFKSFLDLSVIEQDIEANSSIVIARIKIGTTPWSADFYRTGYYVRPSPVNGFIYRVERLLWYSDSGEPTWPIVEDDTIVDNQIVWKAILHEGTCTGETPPGSGTVKSICEANSGTWLPIPYDSWQADTSYVIGNIVRPTTAGDLRFQAIAYINKSDAGEPVWPTTIGETIVDKDLIWIAVEQEGTPSDWVADTDYAKASLVIATDQVASNTENIMFQVQDFRAPSDVSQPVFPTTLDEEIVDNRVVWITRQDDIDTLPLDFNQYFIINENITLS